MSWVNGGTTVRLAVEPPLVAAARGLAEQFVRCWYFDEEDLTAEDQQFLDAFEIVYGPATTRLAFVCLRGRTPVGLVLADADAGRVRVSRLYTRPEVRRRRVATALLGAVQRHCLLTGAEAVAMTPLRRPEVGALFARNGYAPTGAHCNGYAEMVLPVPDSEESVGDLLARQVAFFLRQQRHGPPAAGTGSTSTASNTGHSPSERRDEDDDDF